MKEKDQAHECNHDRLFNELLAQRANGALNQVGAVIDRPHHHAVGQVARELANLLPLLEPDPETPAAMRRRPPTIP